MEIELREAPNKIHMVRSKDDEMGALLNDISDLILQENYRHAAQACAYLLVALAARIGRKPVTVIRWIS